MSALKYQFGLIAMSLVLLSAFAGATSTTAVTTAARCSTQITTVYVGHSLACGPKWSVELDDLGQPNANGVADALLTVSYDGANFTTIQMAPGTSMIVSHNNDRLRIAVKQTFAGLYAYQKWAKLSLESV